VQDEGSYCQSYGGGLTRVLSQQQGVKKSDPCPRRQREGEGLGERNKLYALWIEPLTQEGGGVQENWFNNFKGLI